MTEQEWLACGDLRQMLTYLRVERLSQRKLLLFGLGCCRRVLHRVNDQRSRLAVETAERHVEGQATVEEVDATHEAADDAANDAVDAKTAFALWTIVCAASSDPVFFIEDIFTTTPNAEQALEEREEAAILRDIFGNPFRPVTVEPAWRTATVVSIATAIYDERAFDRLPILADALEDAGCGNTDILNHCRQPGEHVRGCWALDLVLDKR